MKKHITEQFKVLQDTICQALENTDGKAKFQQDLWERPAGGGGRTRVIKKGKIIEKGGVNFSAVWGKTPTKILKVLELPEADFYATGVSIVLHPKNPYVPIIHMNIRYFEMSDGTFWFGGGIDLTPHYIDLKQAQFFHQQLKEVCDRHHPEYYTKFKKWADDYFYLKHRSETRGIGGIFFDHLKETKEKNKVQLFDFVIDIGSIFIPIYTHLMKANKDLPYGEIEEDWQKTRRGRYVEFNLIWDKGTKFGLDTNGRTESILMSLPPLASWEYDFKPKSNSKEAQTQALLRKGIDWINIK